MAHGLIGKHVLTAGDMSAAIRELQSVARHVHRFHRDYDLFLTPTLGRPPVEHGALGPQDLERRLQEAVAKRSMHLALKVPGLLEGAIARAYGFAPFTQIGNVTGQPSMSVPLYWSPQSGLPIGTCLTAASATRPPSFVWRASSSSPAPGPIANPRSR